MSESTNSNSEGNPPMNRRASDRGDSLGGIAMGGRRKTDRQVVLGRSKAARIAIACSFFFSLGVIAWAFTLPFRSGMIGGIERTQSFTEAELKSMEYEARLSNAAYVQYGRDIDFELMENKRTADEERSKGNRPSKRESREKWEMHVEKMRSQLEAMKKDLGPKGFVEGTMEYQTLKEYEKVLLDAPPEA